MVKFNTINIMLEKLKRKINGLFQKSKGDDLNHCKKEISFKKMSLSDIKNLVLIFIKVLAFIILVVFVALNKPNAYYFLFLASIPLDPEVNIIKQVLDFFKNKNS